jgi:oligosaccharide repeat unit polymerase
LTIFIISIFVYFLVIVVKVNFLINILPNSSNLFKINPVTIFFWSKLPIDIFKIIIGPLFIIQISEEYYYVGLAILLSSLSEILELLLFWILKPLLKKIKLNLNFNEYKVNHIKYNRLSNLFFILFLVSFYLLASKEFGLINWILNPREGYQLYRLGSGHYWALSVTFLSLSFSFIMLRRVSFAKRIFIFLCYAYFAFILGSKGMLIEYFVFLILILCLFKEKYINKIIVLGAFITIAGLLYNFFTSVSDFNFNSLATYFSYYTNSGMYLKEYLDNKIQLFYGEIFLSDFWSLVPRSFYPNKPFAYGIVLINEYFFPGAAEQTNTPAFGGPIPYFADFGIFGVIIFTLLNPIMIIRSILYLKLLSNIQLDSILNNNLYFLLFILFYSPYLFILIAFPLNLILMFLILLIVIIYSIYYKNVFRL